MTEPWQIRLYRRSIKKKETLEAVLRMLPPVTGRRCLEIGCATGTSSWLLRQRGGEWVSSDFDPKQVRSARELLKDDVLLIEPGPLPFPDASFDVVVGINFLEHLEDDHGFVREMVRVLRAGGSFLLTCPDGPSGRPGYRLKKLYRFTADTGGFGHARDGYSRSEIEALLRGAGLEVERLESYSRLFTELVENSLNLVYHKGATRAQEAAGGGDADGHFHGDTSPASGSDFQAVGWKFRAYAAAYPLLRGFSLLDRVIPFTEGYMWCARARKPAATSHGRG
ncbi:MAG: class I SAM-dependent methyltransferase [Gemmatimonadetes bacterium]|nr:class I SAM-dependent methyltransferase [Gemmatimonadota bacterium]